MNNQKLPLLRLVVLASTLVAAAFTSGCQSYIDAMNSLATSGYGTGSSSSSYDGGPSQEEWPDRRPSDASAPGIK